MKSIARFIAAWGAEDLVLDLHRYLGGLCVAVGLAAYLDRPSVAPIAFGVLLVYIGIRRP